MTTNRRITLVHAPKSGARIARHHHPCGAHRRTFECDASHDTGSRTRIFPGYIARQHLQIIGNNADYRGLQRDTGTELSVLLVP
jgi:hypothetical protein